MTAWETGALVLAVIDQVRGRLGGHVTKATPPANHRLTEHRGGENRGREQGMKEKGWQGSAMMKCFS